MQTILAALAAALLLVTAAPAAAGQDPGEPPGLRVYLDCERCDDDYLRTEIRFVEYVRDRQAADVHVLVTTQETGAGGTEYELRFVGLGTFVGLDEDLRYVTGPADSEDERRRGMARVLQGGLVRYATRTPLVQRLELSLEGDDRSDAATTSTRDPWNAWVFEVRLGGDLDREASRRETEVDASVSASRTTAAWKTELEASTRYSKDDRRVREEWILNEQRDHDVTTLAVRSISDHWSLGGTTTANHSTFLNRDFALRLAPALEYNLYPYSESTRRSLTVQYSIGGNRITYLEATLYGQVEETLVDQALALALDVRQPWGSVDLDLEGSHYFHDPEKYRLEADGGIEINLFRGLSVDVRGSAERIHDQLHLPGSDLTPEEILLEQRELATAYRYGASFGLSYSFGSIFNSVVNPRMGGDDFDDDF